MIKEAHVHLRRCLSSDDSSVFRYIFACIQFNEYGLVTVPKIASVV